MVSDKEIEAARGVLERRVFDEGGCEAQQVPAMVREMLEAAARVREEDNAGVPVEVLDAPIAKGLLSDEDAKAAGLGRFGHHPNPAIDFEIEVESLQSRLFDAKHGISKPGTAVESIVAVLEDIQRAMSFRVGGDEGAVKAKQLLRQLENEALSALTAGKPEQAVRPSLGIAGYRLLAPGELDAETVERAAQVAESTPAYGDPVEISVGLGPVGERIASAIRALKDSQPQTERQAE